MPVEGGRPSGVVGQRGGCGGSGHVGVGVRKEPSECGHWDPLHGKTERQRIYLVSVMR